MVRGLGCIAAMILLSAGVALAQEKSTPGQAQQQEIGLSQADLKALTEARIGVLKAALQLTPAQAQYWPALEDALRARASGRQQRLTALAAKLNQQGDFNAVEFMRQRAENLISRGTELKKLADAWQPLAQSLSPEQERRLRFFAENFFHVVRNAFEERQLQLEEEGPE